MTRKITPAKGVNVPQANLDAFRDRMIVAVKQAGGPTAMSKKADLSTSVLNKWKNGKSEPTLTNLISMAQASGVDLGWLVTGEGDMHGPLWFRGERDDVGGLTQSGEYAPLPLYDIRAAGGHGALVEAERVSDTLMFKRSWIHQELHAQPNDLYLIFVDGESMEPTLRPGDIIVVDRREANTIPRDGIYVLRMDNSLLVKRLQRLPGRKVKVTSDNPAYEAFDLALDAPGEDLAIIGRVVWSGRRM